MIRSGLVLLLSLVDLIVSTMTSSDVAAVGETATSDAPSADSYMLSSELAQVFSLEFILIILFILFMISGFSYLY